MKFSKIVIRNYESSSIFKTDISKSVPPFGDSIEKGCQIKWVVASDMLAKV